MPLKCARDRDRMAKTRERSLGGLSRVEPGPEFTPDALKYCT